MTARIETPAHAIDREIYAMPAFVSLPTTDMAAARSWYRALGFVELAVMPPDGDAPQLVHLRRYRYQDLLLVPAAGPVTPGDGRTSFAHAGTLAELDAVAEAARADGGGEVDGPRPTPWHSVDLVTRDPDGHVVVLTARPDAPPPEEWSDAVRAAVRD